MQQQGGNENRMTKLEKDTFGKHFLFSVLDGLVTGALALNEFVFVHSLHGSEWGLSFLFQFSVIVLLVSVFINEYLKRYRNKKKILRYVIFMTRIPMLAFFFFPESYHSATQSGFFHLLFLAIFLIYFLSTPVVFPLINLFLKHNYSEKNFGKLYSYAETAKKIMAITATFLFGLLLDYQPSAYTYIYPVLGLTSVLSIILLSRIDTGEILSDSQKMKLSSSIKSTFRKTYMILQKDKAYRDFEAGFMFYGIAFMITAVVFVLFFDRVLHLNYSSVAFYKNYYNLLAIATLPFFGKYLDKTDPRKFGMISFAFLWATILFVMLSGYFPGNFTIWNIKIYYALLAAYTFYGLFAAMMALLWFIGSSYFTSKENADTYQAAHLTLTGLRGLLAPFIGVAVLHYTSFTTTFLVALLSATVSVLILFVSLRGKKDARKRF